MTFVWLIIWWIKGFPEVHLWNSWAVGLAVCIFIDVLGRIGNYLDGENS